MANEQRALLDFYYGTFADDIGLLSGNNFAGTRVSDGDPTIIYDLNGQPLFADYRIVDGKGTLVGTVRSSGRDTDMPLIDSIQIGNPWYDEEAAREKALAAAKSANLQAVGPAKLVCYGYPRLGILVTGQVASGGTNLLYDAASGALVRQWVGPADPVTGESGLLPRGLSPPDAGSVAGDEEGVPFYSFLNAVPEGGAAVGPSAKQWAEIRTAFGRAQPPVPSGSLKAMSIVAPAETAPAMRVAIRGSLLPAHLFSQMTEVFCAVAAAEMILSFVGIDQTQNEIAAAMHTSAAGTTNPNFVQGIAALSGGALTAQFLDSPDFSHFVGIIEQMLPAKSGIPGHARLLRGWREYIFFDDHGNIISKQQFLVINDPYPVSSGQLVMENIIKPIDGFYTNAISVGLKQGGTA